MFLRYSAWLLNRLVYFSAIGAYALSLALPVFDCGSHYVPNMKGYQVAWMGAFGLFAGEFRWCGNLFFLVMLYQSRTHVGQKGPWFWVLPTITVGLAVWTLTIPALVCGENARAKALLLLGGYFWAAALTAMAISALTWQSASGPHRTGEHRGHV